MKKSFKQFESNVHLFCTRKDFIENRDKLKELRVTSYETFISLLQLGGGIVPSIRVADEIFKISVETSLTEEEIVRLSNRFRFINGLLDNTAVRCEEKIEFTLKEIRQLHIYAVGHLNTLAIGSENFDFIVKLQEKLKNKLKSLANDIGNYTCYGKEWEKEMIKFPKKELIRLLKKEYQKRQENDYRTKSKD